MAAQARQALAANRRIILVACHDMFMVALAFEFSVWFRFLTAGQPKPMFHLWHGTAVLCLVSLVVFERLGLFRAVWRYASLRDLRNVVKAATYASLIFVPLFFLMTRLESLPRSVLVINWLLTIVLLAGPRLLYRIAKDRGVARLAHESDAARQVAVLLVGAGDAGEAFIREMQRDREAPYGVVAIIDRRANRIGREIHGVRVMGDLDALEAVVAELDSRGRRPQRVIIASDRLDGAAVGDLLEGCERLGLPMARVPRLTDLQSGVEGGLDVRPIAVEDLLGRPQKILDRSAVAALIGGRRVLVSGAGGTIGSELVRQVAALGPAQLILLDNSEYALYRIDLELAEDFAQVPRSAILGDVRERARIDVVFARERPEIVLHAAAFKHVPMVEANPNEGVLTNIVGTVNMAEACRDHGAQAMVLISTDKAVKPSSVMGASKRIAEMVCQGLSAEAGPTRFVAVRFGNVLGSTGSVVPLFQRQLQRGGPLTVTDPEITRYFMTTREAVELVLQASAAAADEEEAGRIHVLDMGEPVRIRDLARQMIRLAGLRPEKDVKIEYTGLRPGEKLFEELFYDREAVQPTAIEGVLLAAPGSLDYGRLKPKLAALEAAATARETDQTLALLRELVPEFQSADGDAAGDE